MWTLQSGALRSRDRTFSRALGFIELSFHWDGAFSGASDCILHQTVQFPKVSQNRITDESFRRAWLAAKGHFPILGAEIKERDSGKTVEFIVREANLAELGEREVVFLEGSAEVASQVVEDALNGPRKLSNNKLASLTVIRPEKDDDPTFHLVINIAHVITDGIGSSTLVRSLLEHLASCDQKPLLDLRERLAMAVCAESLTPTSHLNRARRRWRNAVAQILWENSQRALRGGHGLPGRFSPQTSTTPAQSKQVFVTLPSSLSQAIIQSCRANSITFGYAYPVIAQVALSRFLHRRYLQGQIPEKEWQYRLRQPTHTGGPLNLRPFLNEGWVAAGGEREMNIYVSFFRVTLPFMARPSSSVPATLDTSGAPPFASLLSIKRFFGRCALVKQKVLRFAQHPLFFEIISQREPLHSNRKRKAALHWRRLQAGKLSPIDFTAATAGIDDNVVFAHGGSSIGNMDRWLPLVYPVRNTRGQRPEPLQPTSTTPILATQQADSAGLVVAASHSGLGIPARALCLLNSVTHLRCRPAELYLGSSTSRSQMSMFVYYDGNVYDEGTVREWLEDVKGAAIWYLGNQAGDAYANRGWRTML